LRRNYVSNVAKQAVLAMENPKSVDPWISIRIMRPSPETAAGKTVLLFKNLNSRCVWVLRDFGALHGNG
jgi:hypothetical protein